MVTGKRYQVFSIKDGREKDGRVNTTWVRAGSAWVNRDGSMNVYLDVLPLDGKLHVREATEKRDTAGEAKQAPANGSPSQDWALELGGH